ncbi:MAG TPA: hypothetical protein VN612_14360 [Acidobacteriaceae bacterium]|nr:hypothetical protein [Acidobacteriaceae bacterium]
MGLREQPDADAFQGKAGSDKSEAQTERGQQDERSDGDDKSRHEQQTGG